MNKRIIIIFIILLLIIVCGRLYYSATIAGYKQFLTELTQLEKR